MMAGPSQSTSGVPIAFDGGEGVGVRWAVPVGIEMGGPGVAVKKTSSGEGVGVDSGGGVRVAGFIGVATGVRPVTHEINTLANSVMTPKFTCRFMVILLS